MSDTNTTNSDSIGCCESSRLGFSRALDNTRAFFNGGWTYLQLCIVSAVQALVDFTVTAVSTLKSFIVGVVTTLASWIKLAFVHLLYFILIVLCLLADSPR